MHTLLLDMPLSMWLCTNATLDTLGHPAWSVGFAAMLEERNSGLAAVTEELQGPASEPRPPTMKRGMAGSGLPASTTGPSPRATPRTPRGSLRRDPLTRRPGTQGEAAPRQVAVMSDHITS